MDATQLQAKALKLVAPILQDIELGNVRVPSAITRNAMFAREDVAASAFVRMFADRLGGTMVKAGIEKAGIIVLDEIVLKIGIRSSIEPQIYASADSEKRQKMAACVSLTSWLSAMERVIPIMDLKHEEMTSLSSTSDWHDRLSAVTSSFPDAHDGNVGLHPDGRIVMLDYSIDHNPSGGYR